MSKTFGGVYRGLYNPHLNRDYFISHEIIRIPIKQPVWKVGRVFFRGSFAPGDEWPDAVPTALQKLGTLEQLTPLLEFLQVCLDGWDI